MSSVAETLAELRAWLARVEGGRAAGPGAFQGGEISEQTPRSGAQGRVGPGLDSGNGEGNGRNLAPLGHTGADTMLGGGLTRGALHEVFAAGSVAGSATAFVCGLARRLAETEEAGGHGWLLWVQQDFAALESGEIAPEGLAALGLDPERLILARVADAKDGLRAAAEGLATSALGCVLLELWGETKSVDLLASRRLTLAAQGSGVPVVALRLGAGPVPSAAETRWIVRPAPSIPRDDDFGWPCFDVELARNRHGGVGRWIMEWDCDAYLFRPPQDAAAPAAQPLDSAPADRPAEAYPGAAGQSG